MADLKNMAPVTQSECDWYIIDQLLAESNSDQQSDFRLPEIFAWL